MLWEVKQVSKWQPGSLGCRGKELYWFWREGPETREWALNFIIQNVCIVSFLCKGGTGNLFRVYCDGSWKERHSLLGILKGVGRIHAECVTLKLKWKKQTLLGTYLVLQWLNMPASAGNRGSVPGPGTKIPHAMGALSLGAPFDQTKTWNSQKNKYLKKIKNLSLVLCCSV